MDYNVQISGNYKQVALHGVYEFDDITFIAAPLYATSTSVLSNAIDLLKYKLVTGK